MLVGISEPTMSNRDLAPNVSTSLLANGTTSAAEIRSDSPCSQVLQPEVPCMADAFWTEAEYCEFVMSEKFVPFGAAGPERNGTSWSGLLTFSGTQAMSQLPVPKMVCCRAVPLSPLAVTLTPAACHCFTASSAAALTVLPAELSYRKVRLPETAPLREVEGLRERHPDLRIAGRVAGSVVVPLLPDQGRRLLDEQVRVLQAGGVRAEDLRRVQASRDQQV